MLLCYLHSSVKNTLPFTRSNIVKSNTTQTTNFIYFKVITYIKISTIKSITFLVIQYFISHDQQHRSPGILEVMLQGRFVSIPATASTFMLEPKQVMLHFVGHPCSFLILKRPLTGNHICISYVDNHTNYCLYSFMQEHNYVLVNF